MAYLPSVPSGSGSWVAMTLALTSGAANSMNSLSKYADRLLFNLFLSCCIQLMEYTLFVANICDSFY